MKRISQSLRPVLYALVAILLISIAIGVVRFVKSAGKNPLIRAEYMCPAEQGDVSAALARVPGVKHIVLAILENRNAEEALRQPFMKQLAQNGASLSNAHALARPSQPNYIALMSGSTHGIRDNANHDVDTSHLGDLIEARGKSWKVYAQGYPGGCFLGRRRGKYVRKHMPMLSFVNVQSDSAHCGRVVSADQFASDHTAQRLPDFALYIPDDGHNAHDGSLEDADRFLAKTFGPLLQDPAFLNDSLLIVTFDEPSSGSLSEPIYMALQGRGVEPGASSSACITHYNLLRTIESALGLGTLGRADALARPIEGIWKH